MKKRILLIYHFFHPDPVISARLFSDLAEHWSRDGNVVTVFTCNRLIRGENDLPGLECWDGINIFRFARPAFSQGSNLGRLLNSAILQLKWLRGFWKQRKHFDAVVIGTDPQFVYLMFPLLRLMNRRVKLIHWVFDLYPEAIEACSMKGTGVLVAAAKVLAKIAYRSVDAMVDIGHCMQSRLLHYKHRAKCITLPPWALAEPDEMPTPDLKIRQELFGNAGLGILYSGTVGFAHDLTPFIKLARACREKQLDIAFCFAGYGNKYKEQTSQLSEQDTNIRLAGFATEDELEKRLAAADLHMVSLRDGWEGVVVPSKFFGALAIGRPVLFAGRSISGIGQWNQELQTGYNIDDFSTEKLLTRLEELIKIPGFLQAEQSRIFQVYRQHFSKKVALRAWDDILNQNTKENAENHE